MTVSDPKVTRPHTGRVGLRTFDGPSKVKKTEKHDRSNLEALCEEGCEGSVPTYGGETRVTLVRV